MSIRGHDHNGFLWVPSGRLRLTESRGRRERIREKQLSQLALSKGDDAWLLKVLATFSKLQIKTTDLSVGTKIILHLQALSKIHE